MFWRSRQERGRLRALRKLGAIDELAEPGFDRFVQRAAAAFAAPISLLTLLDDDTLWLKATHGIELSCLPRQDGFCTHAVESGQLLEVCDARADPRFQAMPPVASAPFVRYYLGAPLKLIDGSEIGALCVLDVQPRPPASRDQRAYLAGLARQASQAFEQRAYVRDGLAA